MRTLFILLSTLLAAVVSVAAIANPQPAAFAQPRHQLRQVTRRELAARAKYPEHFFDKREAEPSGEPGPGNPCGTDPSRRRGLEYDQVLAPREVVAFLKGRGQFTSCVGLTPKSPGGLIELTYDQQQRDRIRG